MYVLVDNMACTVRSDVEFVEKKDPWICGQVVKTLYFFSSLL